MSNENKARQYGFIPKKLEISGRPELKVFPLNILFAVFFEQAGQKKIASAMYLPEFETFNPKHGSLEYGNLYDYRNISSIKIVHDQVGWTGTKTISGQVVLQSTDTIWERFFGMFTANGLSKGEPCQFENK